jgi:D-arabinose 1-dehydrogenase-like Zn-dependent alcohol dehydrogenase
MPGSRSAGPAHATIPWLGLACGHCRHCVAGWETLCESQLNSGYAVDGSYATSRCSTPASSARG